MIDTRVRIIAIAGSLLLLALIVDLVRRRRLKEEYSVLWVATAVVLLILASWLSLLDMITDAIGAVALSTTLFVFALVFVLLMLLHFSVRMSALERRLTSLVQELALRHAPDPPAPKPPGAAPQTPARDEERVAP